MTRYHRIIAIVLAATATGADAVGPQTISYTEEHALGSEVVFTQGIWDCGAIAPDRAAQAMTRMARSPERQTDIGAAAGCRRTLDPDRIDAPWRVVGHIATLCEDRSVDVGEELTPAGRRVRRSYVICGREAHALLVERDRVRHVAIDVIDLASYD